jgi:hypothetical protein
VKNYLVWPSSAAIEKFFAPASLAISIISMAFPKFAEVSPSRIMESVFNS